MNTDKNSNYKKVFKILPIHEVEVRSQNYFEIFFIFYEKVNDHSSKNKENIS